MINIVWPTVPHSNSNWMFTTLIISEANCFVNCAFSHWWMSAAQPTCSIRLTSRHGLTYSRHLCSRISLETKPAGTEVIVAFFVFGDVRIFPGLVRQFCVSSTFYIIINGKLISKNATSLSFRRFLNGVSRVTRIYLALWFLLTDQKKT